MTALDPVPLHVTLDVTAVPARPAGAGRYILDLAVHLANRNDLSLVLIARSNDASRWNTLVPAARLEAGAPAPRPLRLAWEQRAMPRLLRRIHPDVHHAPHYTMPAGKLPPKVVTLHDLTVFDHPEWHQRSKVALFRRAIKAAAEEAAALICVSVATADRLKELVAPTAPVHVVYHGVDHDRFRLSADAGSDVDVIEALGIRPPYVAFVGTVEPRKDVPALVRAFDLVCRAHPALQLVIAGAAGWGESELTVAIRHMREPGRVVRLGYVSDRAVPAILRQATAVAYPSRAEGFGLPVLEALACGAPVVTTSGSAMEEVADGAALLVDPGDEKALAGALDMLARGDVALGSRRTRGLAVARRFNWDATAAGHVAAYRSAISH
ncbi:MAG: glycosyltransferase family 1 protein [Actinomycetota bacterium]|nr:glycosyltransferase family 1 protein [Actinomycetota bacterium]